MAADSGKVPIPGKMTSTQQPSHVVAIIGGAVSGTEAAKVFTERGIEVVVFEQNARPYGKIEDGLPRWHHKLRPIEYRKIDEGLQRPLIHFVPLTRIGREIPFEELAIEWGFSSVILANGAWRDRPLEIPQIDDYVKKGLYYQNPFIYWFNHYPEKAYNGPRYEAEEGTIVVGGGLASLDVVKALMFETIGKALRNRGIEADCVLLDYEGCDKVLAKHQLTLETLGVKPCTLFYRRRVQDMPLASYPENATDVQKQKIEEVRGRILENARKKYLFRFQETSRPADKIVENGRLVGLRFIRTQIQGNKVVDLPGTEFEVRASLTISSIGSVPEPISGIPGKGELYIWRDWAHGELDLGKGIYGLGNVVTGKGNIVVSRRHGKFVSAYVAAAYLGVGEPVKEAGALVEGISESRKAEAEEVAKGVVATPPIAPLRRQSILAKVKARQRAVGYDGDYAAWMRKVTPVDLR